MTLTDITAIKVLPMHSINLSFDGGGSVFITNPESDSTWEWSELKQPNGFGGGDVVGYRLEITWILPYGNLETQTEMHRILAQQRVTFVSMELKAIDGQQQGAHMAIGANATTPPTVEHWTYELLINKAQLRPRTELKLKGLFSLDALDVAPNLSFFDHITGF